MGGMGKTQLSLAHVRDRAGDYSSAFWVNARDEKSLRQSIAGLSTIVLQEPGGPATQSVDDEDHKINNVRRWLSESGNDQWLLIFDKYDDPRLLGMDSSTGYDIRGYFPHRAQGSILITTRSPQLQFTRQIHLKKMESIEQSLAILASGSGRIVSGDASATRLAQRLDGLPLALATAGAYLRQSTDSFDDYHELYDNSWKDLNLYSQRLVDYEERTLYSTWNVSFQQVQTQDPAAAELLKTMAYLDNQDLWYGLFTKNVREAPAWWFEVLKCKARFSRAMSTLHNYSLLEVGAGHYSLHTCVHDWTLECLNYEFNLERYRIAIHCVAENVSEIYEAESWVKNRRVLPHARRIEHIRGKAALDWSHIEGDDLSCIANLYYESYMYNEAEEMYTQAMRVSEKAFGPDNIVTLRAINGLGNVYYRQGEMTEAEEMYVRALRGREKTLGHEHTSTMRTVYGLSKLYTRDQDKLMKAEEMYMRALRGREKVLGHEHTWTLNTVYNLGLLYSKDQNKWTKAEEMYMRALREREKTLGSEHTETLATVHSLGVLYSKDQDKWTKAEEMYMRALRGREKTLGSEHTETLITVYNLGLLYQDESKIAEAEKLMMRALHGFKKALGETHPYTREASQTLEDLYELANDDKITEKEGDVDISKS